MWGTNSRPKIKSCPFFHLGQRGTQMYLYFENLDLVLQKFCTTGLYPFTDETKTRPKYSYQ